MQPKAKATETQIESAEKFIREMEKFIKSKLPMSLPPCDSAK